MDIYLACMNKDALTDFISTDKYVVGPILDEETGRYVALVRKSYPLPPQEGIEEIPFEDGSRIVGVMT